MKRSRDALPPTLRAGTEVEVFFRLRQDVPCFPVDAEAEEHSPKLPGLVGLLVGQPRIALTDTWIPAQVLADWPPEDASDDESPIRVRHTSALWMDRRGAVSRKASDARYPEQCVWLPGALHPIAPP